MDTDTPKPPGPSAEPVLGHEKRDASAGWVFAIVLFLFVAGGAIQVILLGYQNSLKRTSPPTDPWRPAPGVGGPKPVPPPGPRLQVSPPMDLQAFRAREEAELHSYGWINRTAGVVRLPIERAMALVLQQGLPTRPGTNANQTGPSAYQLMQQRPEQREPEIKGDQ